jgi:hypothetical protein
MPIEMSFDLPFSLRVDGVFALKAMEEVFTIELKTMEKESPDFPGFESVKNVAIMFDDSNCLYYTNVQASFTPRDEAIAADPSKFSRIAAEIAVGIANTLLSAMRIAYDEYHFEYFYSADKLGSISFRVPPISGRKRYFGWFDGLQGGITFARPPRTGVETVCFADALLRGVVLSPASELLFEAKRYLLRRNMRMALANLSISFEVGLADLLGEVARYNNDQVLEQRIAAAALNDLGINCATRLLGYSFENSGYWSSRFVDAFQWMRKARNGVLHKAQLILTFNGRTRDFNHLAELSWLFAERDWLFAEIESATSRVIKGLPARP